MSELLKNIEVVPDIQFGQKFNPYPGLRPFGIEESHLFFGRDGQSDEVLYNLARNKFIAILGASGGGKSSLIFCGLMPILHGGFVTEYGSSWHVIISRPGSKPIQNLAESLSKDAASYTPEEEDYFNLALTESILRSSSLGLVDAIKQLYKINKNILIYIDQFEELFRYRKETHLSDTINETYFYLKLLVEAINQEDIPVFIAITMRSDFIGECAHYQELSSLINKSHYLIPQMTRENLTEAIVGPIAVAGGTISPHLVHLLLNDIGDNPDQLPILQHALMRTWDYWIKHRVGDEPISISHYHAVGGIEKALSEHANEAFNELSPRGKEICIKIFKTLSEKGSDNRGIRRPTSVKELALIAFASEDEIIEVVDKFRISGRSFLSPPAAIPLSSDSIVDLSHESLMRIWDKLKIWVEEEAVSVQVYLRLSESAALYQSGKTGLWRPPDLQLAINWRLKQQPTLEWAQRYAPGYERTIAYLDASQKEYEADEQNKKRLQKRALQRSRITALVLGAAAVLSLGFMLYSQIMKTEAEKQKLLAIEQQNIAEHQKQKALYEAEKAMAEKAKATSKSVEASIQQLIANQEKINAQIQRAKAEEFANEALIQKLLADSSANVAHIQKLKSESSAIDAKRAENRAMELRFLSIAQSMAVKSLQLDKDINKKALIAYQAYLYNLKYKGQKFNTDIYNGLLSAFRAIKGTNYNHLNGHTATVRSIVFNPISNTFYSAGNDGKILLWQGKDTLNYSPIFKCNSFITCMTISINGRWLACGTDSSIFVFDLFGKSENSKRVLKGHTGVVRSLAFSPDCSVLFSSSDDCSVLSWNLETSSMKIFLKRNSPVKCLAFTPDAKRIIGGTSDGKLIYWNRQNMDSVVLMNQKGISYNALSVSPDGSMFASADNSGAIQIWNVSFRKLITTLGGHSAKINDIKFSPDNSLFASSGFDGVIRIWNTENFNYQPYVIKDDDKSWIWSIAFSTDNNSILCGLRNNKIIKWPINSDLIAQDVSASITRNMSMDEWNTFVGKDIAYERTVPDKPLGKGVKENALKQSRITMEYNSSEKVYKIQFASSKKYISPDPKNFNGLENVEILKDGDNYRFLVGSWKTLEEALSSQSKIHNFGFKETFCVVVKDGKLYSALDAKKLN